MVPKYESNLILLGQLQNNKITYYNNYTFILLMQDSKPIIHAKKNQTLFMFDFVTLGKIMQVNRIVNITINTNQGRLTYLVNCNKKI